MSEKTPTLSDVVAAWQKLKPIIDSMIDTEPCKFSERVKLREQFEEFGVLLQRIITSLPQQAKTLEEIEGMINRNRFAVDRGNPTYENDKRYFIEFMKTKMVALEAVMGKEPSSEEASPRNVGKQEEKREAKT